MKHDLEAKRVKKRARKETLCLVEITPKWPQEYLGLWCKLSRQLKTSSNSAWIAAEYITAHETLVLFTVKLTQS